MNLPYASAGTSNVTPASLDLGQDGPTTARVS
jgi:hypothetical protein